MAPTSYKESILDDIKKIRRLNLKEDEVLVVELGRDIPRYKYHDISKAFTKALPKNKVLVCPEGLINDMRAVNIKDIKNEEKDYVVHHRSAH